MKTCVIFTGSGPILIVTTYASLTDPRFVDKMVSKGIMKFIGYELPSVLVQEKYGAHFTAVMNDVKQTDDLRVLDYNGHNVFYNFSFDQMGNPIYYE
ncbi:MAG: hypothetical protein GY841_22655 [FCB group bacterium]|nr:hypothetical protein [FCB group bacterium]